MRNRKSKSKLARMLLMGVIMALYSFAEVGISLKVTSLAMFSDGLHNLSDALSLAIAYWAERSKSRDHSDSMTYGWKRTELLGGLFNGLFLLSMSVFIFLQAIPSFVSPPEDVTHDNALWFVAVAGSGIVFNVIGVFAFLGTGHAHSHGGGGGHGHSHGGGGSKKAKKGKAARARLTEADGLIGVNGDGLSAGGYGATPNGHGHAHDGPSSHGHSHGSSGSSGSGSGSHGSGHDHGHGHSHGAGEADAHGHGHGGDAGHHEGKDHNVWGLLVHFAGDVLTSILVLIVGLLAYFLDPETHPWVKYADPVAAILSVIIIVLSAWPLVRSCSWIILQSTPRHLDLEAINKDILQLPGVFEIHEQHFWQLVDGLVIASMHLKVDNTIAWSRVRASITETLHKHGVHNMTLQPEFIARGTGEAVVLGACTEEGSCVTGCQAEPCCPKPTSAAARRRSVSAAHVLSST